jgi:isoleucyl-tRNA synthetase
MNDEKNMTEDKGQLSNVAQKEVEILSFWDENEIFKKTLEKNSPKGEFVFYDGPPFATGIPHYGHLLQGTIKDVIPRYKTMKGFHVNRKWGWDCHGLPIENLIQKEFNLQTAKDIENFGIEEFNAKAKESVFKYDEEWKKVVPRTGRWVDMENPYTTMHPLYTQSVWWGFKKIYEKGLVFEDFKVMHVSPELETTLSNFEVNQGYRNIKDLSCTVKLELNDQPKTFILAWTTTPWTLPGNVALAVSSAVDYVKVKSNEEFYILAKALLDKVVKDEHEIVEEFKGDKLIGKSYKPLFDYYVNSKIENIENAWKVYSADFVTTEDGTGVVHIAPAFGDDDYSLLKKYKLPFVQHVKINGTFKDEVVDFAGKKVKPKEDPSRIDVEIIKFLSEKNLVYSKEKIEHSYPFCWRTDAPLLNYATSSWFIKVPEIKDKLIANNNKIKWVPETVGTLRFGNWLKDARDWAISRSRFWGTPIPIWKSDDGKDVIVIGSLDELKQKIKSTNKYFLMRHGEALHNVENFNCETDTPRPSHLTNNGKEEVKKSASKLISKKIDLVFVSPLTRTQETSKIVKELLGLNDSQIITDERLKESQIGLNGVTQEEFWKIIPSAGHIYDKNSKGESVIDIRKRVGDFLESTDKKYENKNILIISHGWQLWILKAFAEGLSKEETIELKGKKAFIDTSEIIETDYYKLPHDRNFELDLHRPYIDRITFEQIGKKFTRIPDVFDGWVDSGAMPFASNYYPMKKDRFNPGNLFLKSKNFPADFIGEALDQTRGWFYTLLVWGTALFDKSPFKNVAVSGMVLAADGRKMAKNLKNYPEVFEVLDKFGADSMRYYLISSPVVRADDLKFSEKGVDEVMKKIVLRLDNVVSFYELYKNQINKSQKIDSQNVLDKWVLARLQETRDEITKGLENYELDKASRPIADFVDDLSVWYLRRSRDRIKNEGDDAQNALSTLRFVLAEFAKVLAPFMPFKAEDVYQRTMINKSEEFKKSVHMEDWPEFSFENKGVLKDMNLTRNIVTKALEKRASAGIKVRQPLSKLEIKDKTLSNEYVEIIKDEVNVKEVASNESMNDEVFLHIKITPELKEEGDAREIIRAVQDQRKNKGLSPDDIITINVTYSNELDKTFNKYAQLIKDTTRAKEIVRKELNGVEETKINEFVIKLEIQN